MLHLKEAAKSRKRLLEAVGIRNLVLQEVVSQQERQDLNHRGVHISLRAVNLLVLIVLVEINLEAQVAVREAHLLLEVVAVIIGLPGHLLLGKDKEYTPLPKTITLKKKGSEYSLPFTFLFNRELISFCKQDPSLRRFSCKDTGSILIFLLYRNTPDRCFCQFLDLQFCFSSSIPMSRNESTFTF